MDAAERRAATGPVLERLLPVTPGSKTIRHFRRGRRQHPQVARASLRRPGTARDKISLHDSGLAQPRGPLGTPRKATRCSAPARASARSRPSSRPRSSVSSSAADFEPSVLASRCSSWIRKSSRLPSFAAAWSAGARSRPGASAGASQLLGHVDADRDRPPLRSARAPAAPRADTLAAAAGGAKASFQRSRKRCCWRCTTAGTSGAAWAASSRSRATRSSSIAARRAPSRARASRRRGDGSAAPRPAPARRARSAELPPRHHCSTSCTDKAAAFGSQPCTAACERARRLSWSGVAGGQARRRPRVRWPGAARSCRAGRRRRRSSRSAGSSARNSSGRRSDRSRKRPLTERNSRHVPPSLVDGRRLGALAERGAAAPRLALAYPVML